MIPARSACFGLLEELGLPDGVEQHRRDPVTRLAPPELRRVHPLGKSPVIEEGRRVVAEFGAIIDYVLRHHGDGRLQPAPSSAVYDDFVHWMHYAEGSAMPALIIRINVARVGDSAVAALPRLDAEITSHLGYIDSQLEGRPYVLGDDSACRSRKCRQHVPPTRRRARQPVDARYDLSTMAAAG